MNKPIDYTPQATAAPVGLTKEQRDKILADWVAAKEALAKWKDYEKEIRTYLVHNGGFFDDDKKKGTENVELGNGYKLSAVKKINYKIENKDGQAFGVIEKLKTLGPVAAERAKELFRFDCDIRVSVYNKLEPNEKAIVDSILTTSQGTPTLKMVEPKEKK